VPVLIDGRDLAPPEPLELTLAALTDLEAGDELTLLLYCQPRPLYAMLQRNGYLWNETLRADGTFEIRIRPRSG
jgi:uncharacterized protein (DUF2249 family)